MIDGYTTSRGFVPMLPRKLVWMTPGLITAKHGSVVSISVQASTVCVMPMLSENWRPLRRKLIGVQIGL